MSVAPSDFKARALGKLPTIYTNGKLPDLKQLAIYLLARVIPEMDRDGDHAFAWLWAKEDICVYNADEYATETGMYKTKHKMKMDKGDTTWFYDYTLKGKKRRCVMTTEIWYKPNASHNLSPIAIIFGQMFANGLHIVKCEFKDAE